jgi:hypothetical protein
MGRIAGQTFISAQIQGERAAILEKPRARKNPNGVQPTYFRRKFELDFIELKVNYNNYKL